MANYPVTNWSTDPSSNGNFPGIPMYEGQPPASLNDGVRAVMASVFDEDVILRGLITAANANAAAVAAALTALGSFSGMMQAFACTPTTLIPGWQVVDGSLISRTGVNANLWTFASASGLMMGSDAAWLATPTQAAGWWSPGDGATTFRLPDPRGLFWRILDDGAGVDPGRGAGTLQADQFQGHAFSLLPYRENGTGFGYTGTAGATSTVVTQTNGVVTDGANGTPRVGAETRPVSVAWPLFVKL